MPERSDARAERSDPKFDASVKTATPPALTPLRIYCAETPIIPAIRKQELVELAIASRSRLIYLLTGDPDNVEQMIQKIRAAGKVPMVNLDLLNGFSRDRYAVNYLKRVGAGGIISTHLDPLRHALAIGLYAIQRTFLLDSGAMDTISNQLRNTPVHALEILPALVAPKMLDRVRAVSPDLPVVGGGLIANMKEVESLLEQGLSAVSTSHPEMWIK
jgi:glycerol uptake operon antiterminator